jgi:nucleoside-diphosphate-sugar epimerase
MNIFVAGATGVIGRRVVPLLVADGHSVTALARSDDKARSLERAGARASRVSVFDPAPLGDALEGHEAVVNLATHIPALSRAALPGVWKENDRIRSEGAANLVDGALAAGASVYVQESVTFLYQDADDQWITEESPLEPAPYVRSTLASQTHTERFAAAGGQGILLRFAMFYASDAGHTRDFLRWARRGFSLEPGHPGSYKSMIQADDAAVAVVAVLRAPSGIYNVADDEPLTRSEHDEVLAGVVGRASLRGTFDKVSRLGGNKVEMLRRSQRISNEKIRSVTSWRPTYRSARDGWPRVAAQIAQETTNA